MTSELGPAELLRRELVLAVSQALHAESQWQTHNVVEAVVRVLARRQHEAPGS